MTETRKKPLVGLRVIDMADDLGELCGRLLADLGADVIRVEPPSGAVSRHAPPFAPDGRSSLYFAFRNAGKRSITLDPWNADGGGRSSTNFSSGRMYGSNHTGPVSWQSVA